jgi:hypothetical protein
MTAAVMGGEEPTPAVPNEMEKLSRADRHGDDLSNVISQQ